MPLHSALPRRAPRPHAHSTKVNRTGQSVMAEASGKAPGTPGDTAAAVVAPVVTQCVFYRTAHEAIMNQPTMLDANARRLVAWVKAHATNARTFVHEHGDVYLLNLAWTALASQHEPQAGTLMNTLRETLSVPAVYDSVQPPYGRLGEFVGAKSEFGAVLARKILQDLIRNQTLATNEEFMSLITTCAGYICDNVNSFSAQNGLRVLHTALGKRTCAIAFRDQKFFFDEVACAAVNGLRKNVDLAYALEMIKRAAVHGLLVPTADLKSALTSLKLDNTRGAGVHTLLDDTTKQVFPTRVPQDSVLGKKRTLGKHEVIALTRDKLFVFNQTNPKRLHSKSHALYESYKTATNLQNFLGAGGRYADIPWDAFYGYLQVS